MEILRFMQAKRPSVGFTNHELPACSSSDTSLVRELCSTRSISNIFFLQLLQQLNLFEFRAPSASSNDKKTNPSEQFRRRRSGFGLLQHRHDLFNKLLSSLSVGFLRIWLWNLLHSSE